MYAPFLIMSHHDEDTHRRIIEQAYNGDGSDTTSQSPMSLNMLFIYYISRTWYSLEEA